MKIAISVSKLSPGQHGLHIHAVGKCEGPDFKSAGGHLNPEGKKHGLQSPEGPHAGDLPNLTVGPDRIGHGWRLADDLDGPVAREVREKGLPLEVCVTSNACLGLPVDQHPVRRLWDTGFVVTVNPDDRAITTTTTSRELALWAEHHGFTDDELLDVQRAAVAAAFCDESTRTHVAQRVEAGWA